MNKTRVMNAIVHACAIVLLLGTAVSTSAATNPGRSLFDDNFNNEPLDQPIAAGGPDLGEPVEIDTSLSAIIRGVPRPTPSLELAQTLPGQARTLRFEFLNNEEVTHGDLVIRLTLYPEQLDRCVVYVREPVSSAQSFTSITLEDSGDIEIHDKSGSAGIVGTYTSAADHQFVLRFHMDLGTYDVDMDSVPLLTGRSHGVTGHGIGALMVGVDNTTLVTSRLYLDRIHVTRGDGIFRNGFE